MIIHRVEHNHRRLRLQVHVCETRFERGRGLLLRRQPDSGTAYLLRHCRAIHTIGLHYRIDVLFCDDTGLILRIEDNLPVCRVSREPKAAQVWEMRAGNVQKLGWQVGDRILPC